ncbi:MAG: TPM domain-containing protein [Acidobacteriota bacterium]|nr:TPM domain-containing protein [Acidobacteriota bacterium]
MKLSDHRKLKWILLLSCSAALFFSVGVDQFAQTTVQMPARTGRVNDFAGVVDEKTRLHLENILENVKQKTGIEFDIATIESTAGLDIFDFSRQLAMDWNIGARTSAKKSLLLVLAVKEKMSFTQFSKSVQGDLPEGVLGAMSQRMRALVNSGQFGASLNAGVQHFVSAMAQKLAVNPADFDKTPETAFAKPPATDSPLSRPADVTRPRIAKPPMPTGPATTEASPATVKTSAPRDQKISTKTNDAEALLADEDESEEVELTLTLPLEARIAKLKAFIDELPDSKSKPRAIELLISAHAALGDQKLKKGDSAGGIEQLMLAIADAPVNASEKLFSGVISQIPLNLYLRGEGAAAVKAAQDVEAKFGGDPKRLLAVSAFYVGTEQGGEATRIATKAVSLAPELAEAHQGLGLALHISLRLDEAAGEYKRALELDPNSKGARRGLADLSRALGKAEEALALYRQQLIAEPNDKAARAGLVLSLLDLSRTAEAKSELEAALKADPRNLPLLAGAAYWFVAHNDSETALAHGNKAIEIEPRYTWSHIAVARALIAQKKPLEAERALRFARQFGKFPTLDYELANALASAGLYDEASEILLRSFTVKDSQIEAQLAGRDSARGANFIDLLAPERRASIFQFAAADTENNARMLKALLTFTTLINQANNGGTINEEGAIAAAKEFAAGDDAARVYRELYAASRLLQRGIGFQTAYELAEAARSSADAGMNVAAVTVAVQADEYRDIRAQAITSGGTPDIPEAPRNVLSNLLRGRIEDLSGWARFNQDRLDEAVDHLKRSVNILPEGTPASRNSLWHLGAALERQDKKEEALANYIKSYNAGEPDSIRRTVIEKLYRRIKGSLAGLDEQIGPAETTAANAQPSIPNDVRNDSASVPAQPASSPDSLIKPTSVPLTGGAEGSPTPSATPAPEATPTPAAAPSPEKPTVTTPTPEPPVIRTDKPRTTVTITGQIKDPSNNPITNVVVVLISPQGAVITSTTNVEGNYSFTVAPAEKGYRVIPSRDGFTFEPVDRVLPAVSDDQKRMDFTGSRRPSP